MTRHSLSYDIAQCMMRLEHIRQLGYGTLSTFRLYFICRLSVHSRWSIYIDDFYPDYTNMPSFVKRTVVKRLKHMTYTVGVGRHSNEEVDEMYKHDLLILSELLGTFRIIDFLDSFLLAYLSQRLIGELIVYPCSDVHYCCCCCGQPFSNIFYS